MRALVTLLLFGFAAASAMAEPAYTVQPLERLALYPESSVVAQVVADNESRIAAEVTARIAEIPARVGQVVDKGDVLVKLDQRAFRLALEQASGQVELLSNRHKLAQLQLKQAKSLHASNFISEQALAQRRTELAVLEAELRIARNSVEQARLSLEKTALRAPFAGAVRERLAGEGELALPGEPILTLVEHGRNEVRARIWTREVDDFLSARSVVFRQADRDYPVSIVRIAPAVDPRAQTREAILSSATDLRSGSAGALAWTSATPYLPAAYVQERGERLGVWIEEAGKPVFKPLPAAQVGRPVPVDWPLQTRIIDAGRFALEQSSPAAPAEQ